LPMPSLNCHRGICEWFWSPRGSKEVSWRWLSITVGLRCPNRAERSSSADRTEASRSDFCRIRGLAGPG